MSYDLYFTSPPISREQFTDYFGERPRYKASKDQAWYENESTGVYFSFEYHDGAEDEDEGLKYSVMFNINLFRPHYFVLEAEPEVSAFVQHFGCTIHDPQMEGMENGPYSAAAFKAAWNHSNEFGYRAFLNSADRPQVIHTRPTDELENIWQWNFNREKRSEQKGEDIFIPRIMFATIAGAPRPVCVWPDAISTLIPAVDYLWIPRKELGPKKFFGGTTEDLCIIRLSDALPVIQEYHVSGYEFDAYELPSINTPPATKNFVRKLKPYSGENPTGVSCDQVLNRELVEKCQGN